MVGALSGAATTFGMIAIDVKMIAREARETAAANDILSRRAVHLMKSDDLFNTYPLLGAYFISFGNMNDILSVLSREVGTLHWREVVRDVARQHLRPMKELANGFINESVYKVQGLSPQPIPPEGFFDQVGAKVGKVTGLVDKVYDKAAHGSAKVLNRYIKGDVELDDFIAEAQPWIVSPEAKAEIRQKAERELRGRVGWEMEDMGYGTTPKTPLNRTYAKDW